MKIHYILPICFLLISFMACRERAVEGHGAAKTETKQLGSATFSNIEIDAPVDAHITIGAAPSLTFEGYANVLPYLHSEVNGNTLHIYTDEHTDLNVRKNITATITLPSLSGLDISGASDAVVSGIVNVPHFTLGMSGAGSVDIKELHVQTFDANLSGSAGISLRKGDIDAGSFDVSGSGNINAFGVTQRTASLDLAGSADAEVTVTGKLDVKISGTGSVKYKGHPAVTQEISGVGSVTDAN